MKVKGANVGDSRCSQGGGGWSDAMQTNMRFDSAKRDRRAVTEERLLDMQSALIVAADCLVLHNAVD